MFKRESAVDVGLSVTIGYRKQVGQLKHNVNGAKYSL